MATNIDKKFQNAIDNYSNEIKTLKDYVTAVRKMPAMYASGTSTRAYLSLIREVYQNAVDQVIDPTSPANYIYLYYNESTLVTIVKDNGKGLPKEDIERIVTTPNTSKNYEKKKGEYSSGKHGQGLKVTNALSSSLFAESYKYDGTAARFETEEGYPIKSKKGNPWDIPNKHNYQGTIIGFTPCLDILGPVDLKWKDLYVLVKRIICRAPIGSYVDFEAVDKQGVVHKEKIINKDGIIGDLIDKAQSPICKPITVFEDNGEMKLEAAFVFDAGGKDGPNPNEQLISFCNFCEMVAGTHNDGTLDGICKWFTRYMNNVYLANQKNTKNKTVVVASDIKTGLIVSINAAMLEPYLIGQSKEQLANPEMAPYCRDVIMRGLDTWAKENPQDLLKLCKYFKDMADIRIKSSAEKIKVTNKYSENTLTGYPLKYKKPNKKRVEFIIIEGDSAAGTVTTARDTDIQGIFPIRGKISNAFQKSTNEFFNNPEVQGILKIIFGKNFNAIVKPRNNRRLEFDPYKDVEWEKIIFMADADVDGSHIDALLLRFFIKYMPQLITAGKVYKAVPPLYSIQKSKKSYEYFTENYDFINYVKKSFLKENNLQTLKGVNISNKDMMKFFIDNQDYTYYLSTIADTYAVDPRLLELAIISYLKKFSLDKLKKETKEKFRFMEVTKKKNSIVFNGAIEETNTLFMNEKLITDCKPIIDILKKNKDFYFKLNNKKSSIYEVMESFEDHQPNHLQRYKGLGEMNADQLAESTLLPNSNRMLIRYTIEDINQELQIIREYESDLSKLLDKVGIVNRQDLLD